MPNKRNINGHILLERSEIADIVDTLLEPTDES
jgi:hypothetical protein